MYATIDKDILIKLFELANEEFIKREKELMLIDVSERCICAALMHHIRNAMHKAGKMYDGYFADVEYNRIMDGHAHIKKKTFGNTNTKKKDDKEGSFVCDLLVHGRGHKTPDDLIALEMKKSTAESKYKEHDKQRLKELTACLGNMVEDAMYKDDYLLGIYYEINIREEKIEIIYYSNGGEYKKKSCDM